MNVQTTVLGLFVYGYHANSLEAHVKILISVFNIRSVLSIERKENPDKLFTVQTNAEASYVHIIDLNSDRN